MKWRFVGVAASVGLLLAPSSLNVVQCEPAGYPEVAETGTYEFVHSFTALIAASREVDRRLRLCGDPSMVPVGGGFR